MNRFLAITFSMLTFGAQLARADQCAWMDAAEQKYVVKSAVKLLKAQGEFVQFCQPCGEKGAGRVTKVTEVEFGTPAMGGQNEPNFREVTLNGQAVDLAYLYVRTGSRVFGNVALLVGCPASGIAPLLYSAPGKSPSPVSWDDASRGDRRPQSVKKP